MSATRVQKPLPGWAMPIRKGEREECDICKESAIARVVAPERPYAVCKVHLAVEEAVRDGKRLAEPLVKPQSTLKKCSNCHREMPQIKQGECDACYKYRKAHNGEARPEHLYRRVRVVGATRCQVCGSSRVFAGGRCRACYVWRNKHGADRPKVRHAKLCRNPACERPLPKRGNKKTHHTGLCDHCHEYYKQNGRLMSKGEIGRLWRCECGKRAIHELCVPVAKRVETYWLCDGCYQLEVG